MIIQPARKLSAVVMRREMAKNPAVMEALRPVERAVFLASTDKPISDYTGGELSAELSVALKWICKDVGYRASDESDRQYLIIRTAEILKRYYPTLTLKDFRMAFEMTITGELDDYLPKGRDGQPDRNHYQQFNAEYVCKILGAYKAYRRGILQKAYSTIPRPDVKPERQEMEFYRGQTRRNCVRAFLEYKYRGRMPQLTPIAEMLYYDLLASVGLADAVEITLADQNEIWRQTINDYARRGYLGDVRRLKESGTRDPELEHGSFVLARRKALKRAFAWIAEQEIQITDYIKYGNEN